MRSFFRVLTFSLSAICAAASISAQEVETEVQETESQTTEMTVVAGDGLAAPMIFSTSESFDGSGASSGIRIMSSMGGMPGMSFAGNSDFVMPAPDPFSLLGNPSVQKDLELVGDQLKTVQDLQSQFAKEMKDRMGDLSKGGFGPDRFKGIGELLEKLKAEQKEKMQKVLLPHQIDRLRQVALQTHMKQAGTAGALASDAVVKELEITDEQKDKLKKRAKEVNEQLVKDIAALREKAKQGLLKEVLTSEQNAKLKKMIGDKYEPQSKDWEEQFKNAIPNRKFRSGTRMKKN